MRTTITEKRKNAFLYRPGLALLIFSGLSTRLAEWKEDIAKKLKMTKKDTSSINLVTHSRAGML